MDNFKEEINKIAYMYYPQKLYEFDKDFLFVKETKKLLNKIEVSDRSKFDKLFDRIAMEFSINQISKFEMGKNFPSYIVQIDLSSNSKNKYVLTFFLSLLIPFYHIVILNGNYSHKNMKRDLEYEIKEKSLIKRIKTIIENEISFNQFPDSIIYDRVPKINISEEFSYFNAFFSDYYRINNF